MAALPHKSVAVHILVMVYSEGQSPGIVESMDESVNGNPHPSDAATENCGCDGQLIVAAGGTAKIIGGVTSCTVMVWAAVELFPQASIAVHVRVTLYSPGQSPGVLTSAKFKLKALPQASVAVAVTKEGVAGQLMVEGAGNVEITGPVTSCTLIV